MSMETMVQVNAEEYAQLLEMARKQKLSARRATIKNILFVEKAKKAEIVVTKAEIDARIAEEDTRKASEAAVDAAARRSEET